MPISIIRDARDGGATPSLLEKRLAPRLLEDADAITRFRLEAHLLGRLGGVVTPRLVGAGSDGRGPFLRMECVPFPTLEGWLAHGPAPAPAWVERAIRAAFSALAALHEAADEEGPLAVVHADLSVSNMAVARDAAVAVILDLGLARWRASPPSDGRFRGTIGYVSPEVARGEAATVASDLFALAAALLHASTGATPRQGPSLAALIAQAAEVPLLRPEHDALAARGRGHAALLGCLAHEPGNRPRSARDVLSRL